jgi:hypothetical protein
VTAVDTTALLALFPGADPLLELAAGIEPGAVRDGLPAHVTMLYPFVPIEELTTEVVATLAARLREQAPVEVTLRALIMRAGFVAVAVPELGALTTDLRTGWSAFPPYGGRFGPDPDVHVTVALDTPPQSTDRIAAAVAQRLPLTGRITELRLVGLTESGWKPLHTLPLGG